MKDQSILPWIWPHHDVKKLKKIIDDHFDFMLRYNFRFSTSNDSNLSKDNYDQKYAKSMRTLNKGVFNRSLCYVCQKETLVQALWLFEADY
ncbi:hypothetical protein BpHYR1_017252 [Brachionus plicatilis]|uniref:Uncharacterized protein n=1 Tax=Brachionus plicatilis TaxID=10195 RepID=A0A3M7Q6G8_BRAPC|nr:hypothetical protein BpHYR1_017252 [Brachionus plicatilis]